MKGKDKNKETTATIIEAFNTVSNKLGHGFLEEVYENAMMVELEKACMHCTNQLPIQIYYDQHKIADFYADILVGEEAIIKIISEEKINPANEKELCNAMKAAEIDTGVLLNFGPEPQHVIREMKQEVDERVCGRTVPGNV